jgi:hypothetical protein
VNVDVVSGIREWVGRGRRVFAVAVAALVTGCGDQGPESALLDQVRGARQRWTAVRPAAYDFDLERLCSGCTSREPGPVTVRVRDEEVLTRTYTADGTPVPADVSPHFLSVDGLLDLIEDAITAEAYEVVVHYDPATGVPRSLRIDYEPLVFDEERSYVVHALPRVATP